MQRHADKIAVWVLFAVILANRLLTLTANELGWDVFGYYLYLPATFIHHDPLLTDIGWVTDVQHHYNTSATLYQLTTAPDGSAMYFFLGGMAILYAPFFFLGHLIAMLSGQPADGFSMPYQATLAVGCVGYTLVGLLLLRKVLRRYFSTAITAAVILVIGFGTNYFHFASVKSLETATFLFCGMALLVWNTIRWHEDHQRRHLLVVAACIAVITLIKPSEILCGLIPVLWGMHDRGSVRQKLGWLWKKRSDLLLAVILGLLVLAPQLLYWKVKTGEFVFDSYRNPGVGLDWGSPHIGKVLFSFRKGWLVYTPVMAFALIGLCLVWLHLRQLFWAITVYFLATFYVIASWTEWWYGASFSIRPMITTYAVLAIPMGCTLERIAAARTVPRVLLAMVVSCLVALNLFQTWQFNHWILHDYRTTRDYYFAVLGKTHVPPGADTLLAVRRRFDGLDTLRDSTGYWRIVLADLSFQYDTSHQVRDIPGMQGHRGWQLDSANQYLQLIDRPYKTISTGDHCWVRTRADILRAADDDGDPPCMVVTMERDGGSYGYQGRCAPDSSRRSEHISLFAEYLTPNIRSRSDSLKVYVWHRGKAPIWVEHVQVVGFTPR